MNVLLNQVLNAREKRAKRQQEYLQKYSCPVVSFTMNIAGPVKTAPIITRAFDYGLRELETAVGSARILGSEVLQSITGDEATLAVNMEANQLKRICTAIEEATPMGRLFDMDVLDTDGTKLERETERGCLVCGAPGRACASRRLHSVPELQEATRKLICGHFDPIDADRIADAAVDALIREVQTTPKPGLVDLRNTGSHRDMDVPLFLASAEALRPYFRRCARIGQETSGMAPPEVFPLLRAAGLEAERTMYRVTRGVNTHKGAIYTLGILCAAFGAIMHSGDIYSISDKVLNLCMWIAGDAAKADLENAEADTFGLRLYRERGISGIRGEMAKGLPSVSQALGVYRRARFSGRSEHDAGVLTLLHLIANVDDTNLWHRGGQEGAEFARNAAGALLSNNPDIAAIEALDNAFIERNLSPGGCADLLAAVYLMYSLT